MRTLLPLLTPVLTLATFVSAATPAAADARALESGELVLTSTPSGHRVAGPGGERVALPLAPDAAIGDFRAFGGRWYAAAVERAPGGGPALAVLAGRGGDVERLSAPAHDGAPLLAQPTFLAGDGAPAALVWLAGDADDRMAVRAARFDGAEWATPVTVSPPGPGTQIALAAAALEDGTGLVVWAAYDGTDDEILWSRFDGAGFSAPRPVAADNRVPDITPALVPVAGGALLAWSRYDGNDYRVQLARWDGAGWRAPATVGPRGSVDPGFAGDGTPLLLYRRAHPSGWGVLELDAAGRVLRRATAETPAWRRPVVRRAADGIDLLWPGDAADPPPLRARWPAAGPR